MNLALVDLDGMIYAAGAVVEDVYYVIDGMRFDYKSQANTYCEDKGLDKRSIDKEVDAQPTSHALNALKTMMNAAVKDAGCDAYEAYLSPIDRSNFRFDVDPQYKANRKDAHKPVHFQALRDYAVKHLGAIVMTGMEADDMLSIRAFEKNFEDVVIISVDKDMRQVPTYHFDWRKKGAVVKVSQYDAWMNFYTQVLVGDTVDNIKGCPGIGPAKARKALKDCYDDHEMLAVCRYLYTKQFDDDAVEGDRMCLMNVMLLHLLEKRP